MNKIVEFIEQRLTEDEAAARRVQSTWRYRSTGEIVASDGRAAEVCAEAFWEGIGEHIARHDPAHVLRQVGAQRALLQQFKLRGTANRSTIQPSTGGVWDDLLLFLAAPWSEHPDFDAAWSIR